MRIIAGELRGRRLLSPEGRRTRPTSDRLRETLFNILASRIPGAVVLDLFAGTGALGLEAVSRGAASAVLMDVDAAAVSLIVRNIQSFSIEKKARVIRWDILRNLNPLRNIEPLFDLIFLDPPYRQGMVAPTLRRLVESRSIADDAHIAIEHSVSETIAFDIPGLKLCDQRSYGKTVVTFMSYCSSGASL
jgi:16S rRNA (guanine966-N2)-methyltransferase